LHTVWRVTKTDYTAEAFAGTGAALYGGRWNSKGHRVIYTSEDLALAVLETLVHLPRPRHLRSHSAAPVTVPAHLVQTVARLPRSWKRNQAATRRIGDEWLRSRSTPVLAVPSAMFQAGRHKAVNFLLDPDHPAFPQLRIGRFAVLRIDPRIV
jgi:RES domain-containing protein